MKTRRFPGQSLCVRCLLALVVLLIGVKPVWAVDASQRYDDLFSMSLEQLLNTQVTASTLTQKQLRTAPSSITVFNRTQINNLGAEYLHELLNFVPGFQSYRQAEGSAEYFHSARGHRTSVSSREVLILLDGVRLNRQFDNALAIPMLSLINVESIEFIRGPGSALYGSNAVLGIINITTVKRADRMQFSAGNFGKRQLGGSGSHEIAGVEIDLAVYLFEESGEKLLLEDTSTFETEPVRDPRSGHDVQLTLIKDQMLLKANFLERKSEDFYVAEYISDNSNVSVHKHKSFLFQHGANWNTAFESHVTVAYSESRFEPETVIPAIGYFQAEQSETNIDVGMLNSWAYRRDWNFLFGIDYRHSDLPEFAARTEKLGEVVFYPDQTQELASVYLQTQKQFDGGLEVTLGARYDRYNNIGSSVSPRLGVVMPLTDHQVVKFLYGEAFRAPTMNELYLQTFTGAVQGNPNLDPETIESWEVVWIGQWNRLSTTVSSFYSVLDKTIVRRDVMAMTDFANLDNDEAFYGIEWEVAWQFNEHWMMAINTSEFENLPEADYRQADLLGSIIVNFSSGSWNANISATYADQRKMLISEERLTLDSYWQMNSKIRYALNRQIEVHILARNLLDEDYETPTDRNRHTEGVPNRGRELSLGITYDF